MGRKVSETSRTNRRFNTKAGQVRHVRGCTRHAARKARKTLQGKQRSPRLEPRQLVWVKVRPDTGQEVRWPARYVYKAGNGDVEVELTAARGEGFPRGRRLVVGRWMVEARSKTPRVGIPEFDVFGAPPHVVLKPNSAVLG